MNYDAQEQVNRVVRLGWFYDSLSHFVTSHQLHFGANSSTEEGGIEVYKAALALGLADFLEVHVSCMSV